MTEQKLDANLRYLAESFLSIQQSMRDAGLFPNDRELLTCTSCDLLEDVDCEGRLITCRRNNDKLGQDCGLRFEEIQGKRFRCPQCGTVLQDQASLPPLMEDSK